MDERISSFAPVVGDRPRALILGSMPSIESLAKREYYANPRNDFWRLVARVLGVEAPTGYDGKISMLVSHGIALWDSISSCVRPGSLDKNIRNAAPNAIDELLDDNPTIASVCFNGAESKKVFRRNFEERAGIRYVLLPSSSPVPRRKIRTFEDKFAEWIILRELLGDNYSR